MTCKQKREKEGDNRKAICDANIMADGNKIHAQMMFLAAQTEEKDMCIIAMITLIAEMREIRQQLVRWRENS